MYGMGLWKGVFHGWKAIQMESMNTLCHHSGYRKFVAWLDAVEMTEKLSGGHRDTTFPCVEGVCGQWKSFPQVEMDENVTTGACIPSDIAQLAKGIMETQIQVFSTVLTPDKSIFHM